MSNTITVKVNQKSQTTTEGVARHHKVLIDRPVKSGGTDQGAMGGELFLVALGGCFMSNLLAAVRSRKAPVSDISVEVIATKAPSRFTAIELKISAKYENRTMMTKLVTIAERACLVANSIKDAINLQFTIE